MHLSYVPRSDHGLHLGQWPSCRTQPGLVRGGGDCVARWKWSGMSHGSTDKPPTAGEVDPQTVGDFTINSGSQTAEISHYTFGMFWHRCHVFIICHVFSMLIPIDSSMLRCHSHPHGCYHSPPWSMCGSPGPVLAFGAEVWRGLAALRGTWGASTGNVNQWYWGKISKAIK